MNFWCFLLSDKSLWDLSQKLYWEWVKESCIVHKEYFAQNCKYLPVHLPNADCTIFDGWLMMVDVTVNFSSSVGHVKSLMMYTGIGASVGLVKNMVPSQSTHPPESTGPSPLYQIFSTTNLPLNISHQIFSPTIFCQIFSTTFPPTCFHQTFSTKEFP